LKNIAYLAIICLFLPSVLPVPGFAIDKPLSLVKTIGDDRDDYVIFGLADALITDKKDIFILNGKTNFIAQYDWNGNFKRRFGQKGKGPQDFYFPRSIAFFKNNLYVLDRGNRRIAEINLDTLLFNFYPGDENYRLGSHLSIMKGGHFLGIFSSIENNRGRLGIIDKNGKVLLDFFDKYPINTSITKKAPDNATSMETIARKAIGSSRLAPVYHLDSQRNEILISFLYPDNPLVFYVYDTDGKPLKRFSYSLGEKNYRFCKFFLEAPLDKLRNPDKYPVRSELNLDSVSIYGDHYFAFVELSDYEKNEKVKHRRIGLIFDRSGILKTKFDLPDDLRIFAQCNGYFLGKVEDEDVERLYIYRMASR
jgi:hypothetical protein